jgi:uncharacterized protein with LGFP repeats
VKWAQLEGHSGFLGYPLTDETGCPRRQGRFNHVEGESIYWREDIGVARGSWRHVRELWNSMGWETGRLGYPLNDERGSPDKGASTFQIDVRAFTRLWRGGCM